MREDNKEENQSPLETALEDQSNYLLIRVNIQFNNLLKPRMRGIFYRNKNNFSDGTQKCIIFKSIF